MATQPTPFSIGNAYGVFQVPTQPIPHVPQTLPSMTHAIPPTGGEPPGFRHGSGAARPDPRTAQYGGPMGLTPASSPGPGTRRRNRDRERSREGRMDDDEPRARSHPSGTAVR